MQSCLSGLPLSNGWTNSHKLDFTDAGLLKDLVRRSETADGADLLVLKGLARPDL
jgi:hypothetical protein